MENLYKEVDEIKGIYGEPASSLEYFGILWIPKFLKFKIVTTSMCISLSSMSQFRSVGIITSDFRGIKIESHSLQEKSIYASLYL